MIVDLTHLRDRDRVRAVERFGGRIVELRLLGGLQPTFTGRILAVAVDVARTYLHDVVLDRGELDEPAAVELKRVQTIRELTGPELTEAAARLYPNATREDTAP